MRIQVRYYRVPKGAVTILLAGHERPRRTSDKRSYLSLCDDVLLVRRTSLHKDNESACYLRKKLKAYD